MEDDEPDNNLSIDERLRIAMDAVGNAEQWGDDEQIISAGAEFVALLESTRASGEVLDPDTIEQLPHWQADVAMLLEDEREVQANNPVAPRNDPGRDNQLGLQDGTPERRYDADGNLIEPSADDQLAHFYEFASLSQIEGYTQSARSYAENFVAVLESTRAIGEVLNVETRRNLPHWVEEVNRVLQFTNQSPANNPVAPRIDPVDDERVRSEDAARQPMIDAVRRVLDNAGIERTNVPAASADYASLNDVKLLLDKLDPFRPNELAASLNNLSISGGASEGTPNEAKRGRESSELDINPEATAARTDGFGLDERARRERVR
jgi:hypothetical protein